MVSFVSNFRHGKYNYGYLGVLDSLLSLATKFIYFILQVICLFWTREPILLWFIIMQIFQGFVPLFQKMFITPQKNKKQMDYCCNNIPFLVNYYSSYLHF